MHAEMRYCNKISVITSEEKNLEDMGVDGWEFLLWRWDTLQNVGDLRQTARRHDQEACRFSSKIVFKELGGGVDWIGWLCRGAFEGFAEHCNEPRSIMKGRKFLVSSHW